MNWDELERREFGNKLFWPNRSIILKSVWRDRKKQQKLQSG
jgi:hypothetical protein